MLVRVDDLLFPRELTKFEEKLAERLLEHAENMLRAEYGRCGMNFDADAQVDWKLFNIKRVIGEMVSAALLVGASRGMRSGSSTSGPQSDSVTWADVESVKLGGMVITDEQRDLLGLCRGSGPRFSFPAPGEWPEELLHPREGKYAEYSERRRC